MKNVNFTNLIKVEGLKKDEESIPKEKGVYKWFAEIEVLETFLLELNKNWKDVSNYLESTEVDGKILYCFYVGQTKDKKGLYYRIYKRHISGQSRSTLRKSIKALGLDADSVLDKCYVQWIELEEKKDIKEVENEQINSHLRILNLKDFDKKSKHYDLQIELARTLKSKR